MSKLGFAVDIGTSKITTQLINLDTGNIVSEISDVNPQNAVGYDIITRIKYGLESSQNYSRLADMLKLTLYRHIIDLLEKQSLEIIDVSNIVVVGNTVMHHLFYTLDLKSLNQPPFDTPHQKAVSIPCTNLGFTSGEGCECYSPPIVKSFVGSDALAVCAHTKMYESGPPMLALDIGANTEILLRVDDRVFVASAASGPAFEGMALECGMPATTGAIDKVTIMNVQSPPTVSVIDEGSPKGICGTGAISALSEFIRLELIDSRGSFMRSVRSPRLSVDSDIIHYIVVDAMTSQSKTPITISQPDIRMLQQSKAAIYAGIEIVLSKVGITIDDIESFYLTGVFGSNLDIGLAEMIGLLPRFPKTKLTQESGGALSGARLFLTRPELRDVIEQLSNRVEYIDLMDNPEYDLAYSRARLFPSSDQ
ncbi:MAG: ASKHA domain-containing protein [Candidatus Thorarchaeota archaeon]